MFHAPSRDLSPPVRAGGLAFLGGRLDRRTGVRMRVAAFMGGHSLKAREGAQPTKSLIVKGMAIMGGVEVRN